MYNFPFVEFQRTLNRVLNRYYIFIIMRQSNLLALSQVVFIPICTQNPVLHKYKILMHKKVCRFTNLYVYIHVRMYFQTFTCTSFLYTFCLIIHDAFFSLTCTYLFSHINRLEMEQMLFNCYKIMSIGLKKEQQFVSFTFSCSVSLAAQSVWAMLKVRLSFFNSSVAGLSQYFTVLSRIAFQLWSSSGEIHPDVQRFVSSRTTALKGFHDGYKGEKLSRPRDFSEG